MSRFDIYTARVHYIDEPNSKPRPIIQIKSDKNAPNSFAMISGTHKKKYPGDVDIEFWKEAGLKKPSRVRLGERVDLPECCKTAKPVGKLLLEDAKNVHLEYLKPHKIQKHFAEEIDDEFTMNSMLED